MGKTLYVFDSHFEIRMPNMKIKQQNNRKFCHEVYIDYTLHSTQQTDFGRAKKNIEKLRAQNPEYRKWQEAFSEKCFSTVYY